MRIKDRDLGLKFEYTVYRASGPDSHFCGNGNSCRRHVCRFERQANADGLYVLQAKNLDAKVLAHP